MELNGLPKVMLLHFNFFSASPSSTQRARFKATVAQSTQQELAGAILLMGQPVRYTLHGLKFQVYFAWVVMSGILCMGNLSGIFTSGSTFQVYFSWVNLSGIFCIG